MGLQMVGQLGRAFFSSCESFRQLCVGSHHVRKPTMTEVMYGRTFCERANKIDAAAKSEILPKIQDHQYRIAKLRAFMVYREPHKVEAEIRMHEAKIAELREQFKTNLPPPF